MADDTYSDVLTLVTKSVVQGDPGKVFLLAGFGVLGLGCYAAYRAIDSDPAGVSRFQKFLITLCCAFGGMFIIVGATIGYVTAWKTENSQIFVKEIVSRSEAFERLKENDRVSWLVRLIAYDPNSTEAKLLNIENLKNIGRDGQKFTFVADYDELRGRTAAEAVRMTGLQINDTDKVSAIIFPVASKKIYPVNARGLLQVIDIVDADLPADDRVNIRKQLQRDALDALSLDKPRESPSSYAWKNYSKYYGRYCQVVQNFRCSSDKKVAAFIGDVTEDWHPLGFARRQPLETVDPCQRTNEYCSISDLNDAKKKLTEIFGSRVFLTRNVPINSLPGRILIDFSDPKSQKIPYLYLPGIDLDKPVLTSSNDDRKQN